ncbi:MAG TPA: cytochrome c-type biogenesis protein [Anaerolineales bacterium]|nr:cytochrome c-type biogenesis protein [Anaerolineales bacterium]
MRRFSWVPILVFISLAVWVRPVAAQQPTPSDDEVNAIASQLYCPVCENTPLDVCPTQACHDWRELIRQMLAEGKTTDQIKQYFVDHYGARVLSEPPRTGFNWLVYIVPPLAFLLGVFLLYRAFRTWKLVAAESAGDPLHAVAPSHGSAPAAENEYVSRVEEELRKRN